MCTLLGHNPFHYSVIQLQSFFPYICEEMKKPLSGVPLRCSFRKCTSTSYCIAFTGTSTSHYSGWSCNKPWSDGTGALPYVGTPRPTSSRAPKMARRAPKSTTASSQVREAAKRITTCGVDVLIWTELRRSCRTSCTHRSLLLRVLKPFERMILLFLAQSFHPRNLL